MDAEIDVISKRQYNAIILAGIAIAMLFPQVVSPYLLVKGMPPLLRLLTSEVLMWAMLPLLYLYAIKVEGRDFFLWKDRPQTFWFYITAIAVLFILTFCTHFLSSVPRLLGYKDDYTMMRYYHTLLKADKPMLVFTCITAAFTEELQVRAYILPRLSILFKSEYVPILISALIFSFLHLAYRNLSECIFTFVFGIICGVFYRKYQNIQVLMIFHFLYDLMVLSR